jgi:hypothetical protein
MYKLKCIESQKLKLKLRVHVHSHNICADMLKISNVFMSNHFHHCLRFSNYGNVNIQAVFVLFDLMAGSCLVAYIVIGESGNLACRASAGENIERFSAFRIL